MQLKEISMRMPFYICLQALIVLFSSCIVNPKYSDPDSLYERQTYEYRNDPIQHHQDKEAYEKWFINESSKPAYNDSYIIQEEKISSWSVGNENAFLHVGNNKFKYHHKIKILMVCNKNNIIPTPLINRNLKWKISNSIFGDSQTSSSGELQIHFVSENSEKYSILTLNTDKAEYKVSLNNILIVEASIEDCATNIH